MEILGYIISAFIGAVVAVVGVLVTKNTSCRQIFAQTVSQSRINWIVAFRDNVGDIVSALYYIQAIKNNIITISPNTTYEQTFINLCTKADKSKSVLLAKLNTNILKEGNDFNLAFTSLLKLINFYNIYHLKTKTIDIQKQIDTLQDLTKALLENEWQKVKREAKGEER